MTGARAGGTILGVTQVWDLVAVERRTLADFLETLSAEEWAVDSLCAGWTVRDVAAHVAWGNTSPPLKTVTAIVRGGFRANAVNARLGREWGRKPTPEIVARLREVAEQPRAHPRHHAGRLRSRTCSATTSTSASRSGSRGPRPPSRSGWRSPGTPGWASPCTWPSAPTARRWPRGSRLVAEDVGWTHGEGPTVQGSGSALMRALTGRAVGPEELSGPGAPALYARLP